jgi:PA14 domain
LKQQVIWRRARLAEQRKAYDDAQSALTTLKDSANDAAANLAAGRYRCFFQEDWKAGLPLLAKGSDEPLKRLAEQELTPPGEAVDQVKLGDEWTAAARPDDRLSMYYQMRARQWYEVALPRLAGVSKLTTQAKIDKMLGGHGLKAEYFSGSDSFNDKIKSRVDPQIDFKWGQTPPDDLPSSQFSVRWTGWLVPPPGNKGGQFTFVLDHDAGARLSIDGKPVIDAWAIFGRQETPYLLQANKPRQIKVEYFSNGKDNGARVSLRWSQKDSLPEQAIPAEALYQDRSGAEKGFAQLPVPKPGSSAGIVITSSEPVPDVDLPTSMKAAQTNPPGK